MPCINDASAAKSFLLANYSLFWRSAGVLCVVELLRFMEKALDAFSRSVASEQVLSDLGSLLVRSREGGWRTGVALSFGGARGGAPSSAVTEDWPLPCGS